LNSIKNNDDKSMFKPDENYSNINQLIAYTILAQEDPNRQWEIFASLEGSFIFRSGRQYIIDPLYVGDNISIQEIEYIIGRSKCISSAIEMLQAYYNYTGVNTAPFSTVDEYVDELIEDGVVSNRGDMLNLINQMIQPNVDYMNMLINSSILDNIDDATYWIRQIGEFVTNQKFLKGMTFIMSEVPPHRCMTILSPGIKSIQGFRDLLFGYPI